MEVSGADAAAIEDSHNGIRAAHAAGMRVVAVPNPHFPPDGEALALADVTLDDIAALTADVVRDS
jgi:beta-phosphoglucomutase-like phosphatase (HAD superfamily)